MSDYLKEGFIDQVKGSLNRGNSGGSGTVGSGQENVIEKIKVNGVEQSVDGNKAVNIPVPTKTSELENDEGFLKEHQDLSEYAKSKDVPTVPSNVSEFTNDKQYQTADDVTGTLEPYAKSADVTKQITDEVAKIVANAPEDFDTLKEMSDWIANHENDASAMNSAIQANKTDIAGLCADKADLSDLDGLGVRVTTVEGEVDGVNRNLDNKLDRNGHVTIPAGSEIGWYAVATFTTSIWNIGHVNIYMSNSYNSDSINAKLRYNLGMSKFNPEESTIEPTTGKFNSYIGMVLNGNLATLYVNHIMQNAPTLIDIKDMSSEFNALKLSIIDNPILESTTPTFNLIPDNNGINQINASLGVYGLDNKSNKSWVQGAYGSDGTLVSSYNYGVADTNYHPCSADTIVSVKMDNLESVDIVWYNGTTMLNRVSSSATNGKAVAVAPTNTTQFLYSVRKAESGDALTPNNVKDVYLYVGNEIDSIKKDLSGTKNIIFNTREIDVPRCVLTDTQGTITSDYGYSYSDIASMLTNGDWRKYIKNGDYLRLKTLNGEDFNLIFNIDTYKNYGDTSYGSHIDLISEHLIPSSYGWQMRTENTNNGTADIPNPYLASTNMIDKLSNYFETNIPAELKSHIVTKRLLIPKRYSAEGTLTDDNQWYWADLGKMWLPFEQEVAGRQVWGSREWQGGFRWYPCFHDGTQLTKRLGETGDRVDWWTASALSGHSTDFVIVQHIGFIFYYFASYTWLAVPLCMRFK